MKDFDKTCFGLRAVRVETWGPFVFVNAEHMLKVIAKLEAAIAAGRTQARGAEREAHEPQLPGEQRQVLGDDRVELSRDAVN